MIVNTETATLAVLVSLSLAIYVVYRRLTGFSVKQIRGPDAPFWLGEYDFAHPITKPPLLRGRSTVSLYKEMSAISIDKLMSETWISSMREIMDWCGVWAESSVYVLIYELTTSSSINLTHWRLQARYPTCR